VRVSNLIATNCAQRRALHPDELGGEIDEGDRGARPFPPLRPCSPLRGLRAALVCLTRVRGAKDVLGVLGRFQGAFTAVLQAPTGVGALALLISYILQATEAPPEQLQPFFDQLGERAKEAFMTGAQMLIERGKAEGRAGGEAKGKAELLLRQMRRKYGRVPAGVAKRLRGAASADLDRWAERVLTEASLDEVFEGR
jgi:hypothetical protein